MHQRNKGFFQFFERYPEAERREHRHGNGMLSTVAVGLIRGHVDGAFIGIYKDTGALQSEENLPLDVIEENFGDLSVGNAELLSRLTELAAAKAKSPIITSA